MLLCIVLDLFTVIIPIWKCGMVPFEKRDILDLVNFQELAYVQIAYVTQYWITSL